MRTITAPRRYEAAVLVCRCGLLLCYLRRLHRMAYAEHQGLDFLDGRNGGQQPSVELGGQTGDSKGRTRRKERTTRGRERATRGRENSSSKTSEGTSRRKERTTRERR